MKRILQNIKRFFGFGSKVEAPKRSSVTYPVRNTSMESTLGAGMIGGTQVATANSVDVGPRYKNSQAKKKDVRRSKATREEKMFLQRAYVRWIEWVPEIFKFNGFRTIIKKGYTRTIPAGVGGKSHFMSTKYALERDPEFCSNPEVVQCTVNRKMRRQALKSLGYLR